MAAQFLNDPQLLDTDEPGISQDFERDILGSQDSPIIPEYDAFQYRISVGWNGSGPGQFNMPRSVSVDEETGNIHVTDCTNNRIQIFSETGEYLDQFGSEELKEPWGILIHNKCAYVTDFFLHSIFQYSLQSLKLIKRVGMKGSDADQFNSPRQPAMSPNKLIYVPDSWNHRLQILDCSLFFQGMFKHQSMKGPDDVKFSNNKMFVLSNKGNPCVHIFTLMGDKIRSVITRGEEMQVISSCNFFVDACDNILICDYFANSVKVFSSQGELIHTIGDGAYEDLLESPRGIAIFKQTKLVCISRTGLNAIHIFS